MMKPRFFFPFFILILAPLPVFAEDDEGPATDLGKIAIVSGIIGTLPFVFLNKLRRYAASSGNQSLVFVKKFNQSYKPILNFHIMMNSIGCFSGMFHGMLFLEDLDSISLSLAIIMTVMMVSGFLLQYTSSRHSRLFNRLLHGQFGLVILLILLIFLHVVTASD